MARNQYHNLCQTASIRNLGLEHFYAVFGRKAVRIVLILRTRPTHNHPAQLKLRILNLESLEEDYYSDLRRYSATLERDFSTHFTSQQLNTQEWNFQVGREGIQRFLTLPTTWPLARLMFPIRDLRKQMETLLQTYCFEIEVTCAQASAQDAFLRRMTLHLVQYLAVFLAETITELLQRVLTHPARGLVDETNAALLTQKFWVQTIYTELLCASSRHRAVREQEQQRPPTGLVKVVCLPFDGRCPENMA